ncbi:4Fe-4S dicluster domain-containing protein [Cobetia marina]|uniref:4Fe-4S dicluster domain-containing protein n=1 Tax=Cobetia marina TaxID=28258 RepID=UPI002548097F|nr:4Fe-4S dicluster domain-containing protein [Cobetia pacifica]MDI6003422.1 4Fe-4S dicluster domain-containing protein [Cobetia pacifica]
MLSSSLENAQRALNQQARQRALAAVLGASPASSLPLLASDAGSAPIRYRSQGRTLLIGSEARLRALSSLMLALPATHSLSLSLLISEQDNSALVSLDERHITTSEALPSHASTREALSLSGHLGHFTLLSGGVNLARALLSTGTRQVETFDLIADLGHQPLNQAELPPPGYLRAEDTVLGELDRLASDASLVESGDQITNLTHWATEFAGLVGSFDKPNYVNVNLDICAHSSAGSIGCTRCLSSCSADAIFSVAGRRNAHIEIDPYLCHGAASCVSACPTGALSFTQPPLEQRLEQIQRLLERYQDAGGTQPILRYRLESASDRHSPLAPEDQERCLDIALDEISATGHDEWLAALALGATQVIVELPRTLPAGQHQQLEQEQRLCNALLESMQLATDTQGSPRLVLITESAVPASPMTLVSPLCIALAPGADREEDGQPGLPIARDWLLGQPDARPGKRERLNRVLDHLATLAAADLAQTAVEVPAGAPFGAIQVESDGCTLCQACVAVCPTSALSANRTSPALSFTEGDCVQCGLCEQSCPESVITLTPGFSAQPEVRREPRLLKQDTPFPCISCGTPFGSTATITAMQTKLASHAYFQGDGALRLKMCSDCRVKDIWHEMARNPDAQLKV